MEIFYREKSISPREKIRKSDFAPSEKYSSYAPGGEGLTLLGQRGKVCKGFIIIINQLTSSFERIVEI